ncbi:MAG: response regulator transcription factor [Candidatus Izemoplasma sp.]
MRILIVEDEVNLNNILYDYVLDKYSFAVIDQIFDGLEALISIQENVYDLILLDVMLPNVGGFEICSKLREKFNTPVIMMSALSDEENQIKGYNLGIDEYITKPYSPKLVIKKIEAILGRYIEKFDEDFREYGIIKYNLDKHKILVEETEISLNKKEWDLFVLFVINNGKLFTRDHLLNKVWGFDYYGDERTVDTHIKRLRQKLNNASSYIKTIYKEGYKFEK